MFLFVEFIRAKICVVVQLKFVGAKLTSESNSGGTLVKLLGSSPDN